MTALNQSQPLQDYNVYLTDQALRQCISSLTGGLGPAQTQNLMQFGAAIGSSDYLNMAQDANRDKPRLNTHDSRGNRLDQIAFHPVYHALMHHCIQEGLHASPWLESTAQNPAHLVRGAKFLMHSGIEPSVLCPISMTYAVVPALQNNTTSDWSKAVLAKLTARQYDARPVYWQDKPGITMGMGMTEKQGGSDVRANISQAVAVADGSWRISGHKWFFSAPMCDAFLVLAQTESGLSCFFMPSYLPADQRNGIAIMRLKNKLGNQANASSEVEFTNAQALLVGEPGRGIQTILEMGTVTRIDCALGTAGLMRRAVSLALDHCSQRKAFGRLLIDQPLMQMTLADMALESEAASLLALRLAHTLDKTDQPHETFLRRLLTPAAKFWICKRGSALAQEAMECLGGNGYVEDGPMASIYREMPLNSIWEGAGNIMGIDLLRALKNKQCIDSLKQELAPSTSSNPLLARLADRLWHDLEEKAADDETVGRHWCMRIALLMQAHLMRHEPALQNAFCATRFSADALACPSAIYGQAKVPDADLIVRRAAPRSLMT
jgi:putative acyl-CoA dehydrogenase